MAGNSIETATAGPSPVVAREPELARLLGYLERALAGDCSLCFVAGEAGAGKSALLGEFARRAHAEHADLLVATGDCNAHTGAGDPYLPFREALGLLTGDVDARLAQGRITEENASRLRDFLRISGASIVESGPDLVGIFVPGGSLLARLGAKLARRVPWVERMATLVEEKDSRRGTAAAVEQSHILEQYTNVLRSMSAHRPIVLLIDDLHWADAASAALLFHLARRLGASRVLIVGAYRADDVALGRGDDRHPLEPVLNELRRYFGDIVIDLTESQERSGAQLVNALIDAEPNGLGADFRGALHRHTGGHPLFTGELLRHLRERGDLVRDEQGTWHAAGDIDWSALPPRVEGVIAERVGRLDAGLRAMLGVAAVEGERFTAEVVARVLGIDERAAIRSLSSELCRRHHLVDGQEVHRDGGRRLSRYAFRHNLVQRYMYGLLDAAERVYLHEDVGAAIEALHEGRTDGVAVQLARHFEEAGHTATAARYVARAGELAARAHANIEALAHLERAAALMQTGGDDGDSEQLRRVYEQIGELRELGGMSAAARAAYGSALALAPEAERIERARLKRRIGRTWDIQVSESALAHYDDAEAELGECPEDAVEAWWTEWSEIQLERLWAYYFAADPRRLEEHTARVRPLVERHGTPAQRVAMLQREIMARLRREQFRLSAATVELARHCQAIAERLDDHVLSHSRFQLGLCLLWHGEPAAAAAELDALLAASMRRGDLRQQTLAATYLTFAARLLDDVEAVQTRAHVALGIARAVQLDIYIACAQMQIAWVALRRGQTEDVTALATEARDTLRNAASPIPWLPWAVMPLVAVHAGAGRLAEAAAEASLALAPGQQPMPDDLAAALHSAIAAHEANDDALTARHLATALHEARAHRYI